MRRLLRFLDSPAAALVLAGFGAGGAIIGLLRFALTGVFTLVTVGNIALLVYGLWMFRRLMPPRRRPAAVGLTNGDTLPVIAYRVGCDRDGVWHYVLGDESGGPLALSESDVTGDLYTRPTRVRSNTHMLLGAPTGDE